MVGMTFLPSLSVKRKENACGIFLNNSIMIIKETAGEYFCRLSFMCVNYFWTGKYLTKYQRNCTGYFMGFMFFCIQSTNFLGLITTYS